MIVILHYVCWRISLPEHYAQYSCGITNSNGPRPDSTFLGGLAI
jgi:hypothetical protein